MSDHQSESIIFETCQTRVLLWAFSHGHFLKRVESQKLNSCKPAQNQQFLRYYQNSFCILKKTLRAITELYATGYAKNIKVSTEEGIEK